MVILQNRLTGKEELAQVVTPIEQFDVNCYLADWKPVLDAEIDNLKRTGQYTRQGVARRNVEDAHWLWAEKVQDRARQLQWNSHALRCGGKTQGLMFVDMLRLCRLPSQQNMHMVYIDLVSTAPWNRPGLTAHPVYRGVGNVLVTEAILHSVDEGFGGRIGLHALPRAESFYRDQWKMVCLGPDPQYSSLPYYELTTERATEFLRP
ncbi:GNAT family N-acetyltransferase [Paraburkholderia sp. SEWSISQ10-3 4]|uniref:GNAT family N-acetyltransferase n=1 Tax=Paraburkholderia TaxID=1822464 RepID=UPI00225B9933|nr:MULTISPECIES: GNAT family N-acetyltransferase [Paraburkholderia]MCX4141119.1 GNAT family N-acetyltransferase [Paraburkholderia aspalathi]MDN7173802.1 GNAT family N-acetyltransferase [Paraburkholderia sp. SEWSISQ10-3 4]MDQ6503443.1 GNAT family N-acetyltransferase [Paraburkholderia aspalathi]